MCVCATAKRRRKEAKQDRRAKRNVKRQALDKAASFGKKKR